MRDMYERRIEEAVRPCIVSAPAVITPLAPIVGKPFQVRLRDALGVKILHNGSEETAKKFWKNYVPTRINVTVELYDVTLDTVRGTR